MGLALLLPLNTLAYNDQFEFIDYVDPLVGTLSDFTLSSGNTYPIIGSPWGMNFWTPQTGEMGNGWIYNYAHNKIKGFKQTHQPSPWINDYGQFSIMPVIGNKYTENDRESWFSHKTEVVKPNYYSVYLGDCDTKVEFAPTERCAIFEFTFPKSDSASVIIDAFDKGSFIRIIPDEKKIIGYSTRNSGGVPTNFKNYFVVKFDQEFDYYSLSNDNNNIYSDQGAQGEHVLANVGFKTSRGNKVTARVASSFISFEQAELNLNEIKGKSLQNIAEQGRDRWNKVLGVIDIDASLDQKRTFYSCLYRSLLFPRMFYEYDKDGKVMHYSPYNGKVLPGYMFTDTGFWDTFRSLFPLLNLFYPEINEKIQQGLLNAYNESGFLPEWASPGHRDCMVGNNSASVVSDAILKGITPKDLWIPLYEAMIKTANSNHETIKSTGRLGFEYYNQLGYIPYDVDIKENAARTLEYAYNDWCIYQVAKKLNRPKKEQQIYLKRSMNYRNLFDAKTQLMRGRNQNGNFQTPFNPLKWGDAFTEGNSWHYTWSVFHDPQGLINLMKGNDNFISMMDSVFSVEPSFDESYYGFVIHEIKEMQIMNMGNYAHGNQPIQHMIYLYNYTDSPWKSQYWTRKVIDNFYNNKPDGYCGDEDNGQTSSWYIFSSLGFYPVCPGTSEYVIGSPMIKKATIRLPNNRTFTINALNNSKENVYIHKADLNDEIYDKNYLIYDDIRNGGCINFHMSKDPNKKRGSQISSRPYSLSKPKH